MRLLPLLNLASLQALNNRPARQCDDCGRAVRKNYCRQCDVYFEAGHRGVTDDCLADAQHDAHRTY